MSGPPPEIAVLVRLSAALAAEDEDGIGRALEEAARVADPVAVDETILQAVLFLGFPVALAAATRWRALRDGPPAERDGLAGPESAAARTARGEAYCRAVYGSAYDALRRNVADAHPALDRWMVETGYGTILGRPGPERRERELCLVAVLAARGWAPQLHSHLRGALRTGAPAGWVEAALEAGLEHADREARATLRDLWTEVRERYSDVR